MVSVREYFDNIWKALSTTATGMRITGKYFLQKPITVQYPDERLPIPDRYRGIHYLEQEKCIDCLACARACPIDCIEMEAIRHGKELEWVSFTLDYQKCMFCELCVYPCPKDCIHMGTEFALTVTDRSELNLDLLSFKGMAGDARIRMREAEVKKKAKAEAKAKAAEEKTAKAASDETNGGKTNGAKAASDETNGGKTNGAKAASDKTNGGKTNGSDAEAEKGEA